MYFELVQPVDEAPLSVGTFYAKLHRSPTAQTQPVTITEWVKSVTNTND